MTDFSSPPVSAPPRRLVDQVNNLRASLARQNMRISDMSRAGSLEMGIGVDVLEQLDNADTGGPIEIDRLEGEIVARPVEVAAPGQSRFRYFLDGSQKTIPICRIGLTPVVAALSAAGILHRNESGQPALMGDSMRVKQTWIAPRETRDSALNRLVEEIEGWGGEVFDPFVDGHGLQVDRYHALAGDYGRMLTSAFDTAGRIRSLQEQDLLANWQFSVSPQNPDDWIVVDGRLRTNAANAIGLVKDLQTQHLTGEEAIALFDLPQAHRTSAFRYVSSDRANPDGASGSQNRTMWYMRLWSASGMDARHSLVRIEAAHDVATTEQIDIISSWILAERLPRATKDPRWPTLLYPIHYLERILKRRLADITAGWPSA